MSAYKRRFTFDPGDDVLLEIESVNIIDLEPDAPIQGVGTGTACLVAEFEDGPFDAPTEVFGRQDFVNSFGSFGFSYSGDVANNPCARARKVDAAILPEYWNGNGHVALNGKKFPRLVVVRADTSVGAVEFTRLATITGAAKYSYNLTSGQHLDLDIGAGSVVATFTGVAATVTGASATFGSIVAGDSVTLGYDSDPDFTVVFLTGDTTITAVLARINQYAGFTFAVTASGQIKLTGRQGGTGGQVRISGSGGTLTKLGLTAATTSGTGNVSNINKVTAAELNTVVSTAVTGTVVELLSNGKPRIANIATPGTGTLAVASTTTAIDFGFPVGSATAVVGNAGVIPAGTLVRKSGADIFVTMQTLDIKAASAGPYSVKVRHATDDGTGLAVTTGLLSVVVSPIDLDAFSVINPLPTVAALSETAIDIAYQRSFDATLDINTVSKDVNIIWSARQSNALRQTIRSNVIKAGEAGLLGRTGNIRPPLGTKPSVALGSAEPSVTATRSERIIYNYPGFCIKVPLIAAKGIAGGAGFTADGVVDLGSDGFSVSVETQLQPEENPGQQTPFLTEVLGLERSANVKGLTIDNYTAFKRGGICAPRVSNGEVFFQSGVTSVDPVLHPTLVRISRRRFADYVEDTIADRLSRISKRLNTSQRRTAVYQSIRTWMRSLEGIPTGKQRMVGFTLDDKSGNTAASLGRGLIRYILNVRTLSSMDSFALSSTVGDEVIVAEVAPGETI